MHLADRISGARQSVRTNQKKVLAMAGNRAGRARHCLATSPTGPLMVVLLRPRVALDEQRLGVADFTELPRSL